MCCWAPGQMLCKQWRGSAGLCLSLPRCVCCGSEWGKSAGHWLAERSPRELHKKHDRQHTRVNKLVLVRQLQQWLLMIATRAGRTTSETQMRSDELLSKQPDGCLSFRAAPKLGRSPALVGLVHAAVSTVTVSCGLTTGSSCRDFVTGCMAPRTELAAADTLNCLGPPSMHAVVTARDASQTMSAPGSSTAAPGPLPLPCVVHESVPLMSSGTDSATFRSLRVPVLLAVSLNVTVSPAVVSCRGAALNARSNIADRSLSPTVRLSASLWMVTGVVL